MMRGGPESNADKAERGYNAGRRLNPEEIATIAAEMGVPVAKVSEGGAAMSTRVIVSGAVGKPAEIRTSKNGNTFATFSVRESVNGSTRWWQAIAFNESVIEAVKELSEGLAVAGEITAEIYAPAGSESRINWRVR
jgi:hypothetical protein